MALWRALGLKCRVGWAGVLLLGWSLAGCQAPPASTVHAGSVQRLATIFVLQGPRKLLEGSAYPLPETRHILRWRAQHFEWEVTLAENPMSYADITLQKPLDLHAYRPKSYLRFRVRPDVAVRDLFIDWRTAIETVPRRSWCRCRWQSTWSGDGTRRVFTRSRCGTSAHTAMFFPRTGEDCRRMKRAG